ITGQPSPLETRVLEKSELLFISRDSIEILKQTPVGKQLFLSGAEWSFVEKQQQQIDLLLKTAEERYLELLHRQSDIILRTSQKHIASYLGITTQSLSRIRRKVGEAD
ncbi:MAG: Crp/Fnr family transcriptional regulator, partial [Bacteroidia bacterium]